MDFCLFVVMLVCTARNLGKTGKDKAPLRPRRLPPPGGGPGQERLASIQVGPLGNASEGASQPGPSQRAGFFESTAEGILRDCCVAVWFIACTTDEFLLVCCSVGMYCPKSGEDGVAKPPCGPEDSRLVAAAKPGGTCVNPDGPAGQCSRGCVVTRPIPQGRLFRNYCPKLFWRPVARDQSLAKSLNVVTTS